MPQTAKDMGIIKNNIVFNYMKNNEKKIYQNVEKIICNCNESINYILENNYKDKKDILFIRNPEYISEIEYVDGERELLRKKYGYLNEDIVFIFGGNMGMLQKLDNILELAKKIDDKNIKFLMIGDGKNKVSLEKKILEEKIYNTRILNFIPRNEYEKTIGAFDCGLISLNENNTVPNFPTKVTAYLKLGLPIFASLDASAARGIGEYINKNNVGIWGKAKDINDLKEKFNSFLTKFKNGEYSKENLKKLYKKDFDIENAYDIFIKGIENDV
jgi:glycosyltransferase involved in cell wall biosynthesis